MTGSACSSIIALENFEWIFLDDAITFSPHSYLFDSCVAFFAAVWHQEKILRAEYNFEEFYRSDYE